MNNLWKITLSEGTIIDNLKLNGNNFVSETELTTNVFEGKLSKVVIEGPNFKKEYENMELVQIIKYDDGYYFVLRELTEEEKYKIKIKADIEYIAMMANIDLEV